MSKDFNWQTGDDGDWREGPVEEFIRPAVDRAAWLKRWGRWIGAGVFFFLIIGSIIFVVLNRQVEKAEDTTTADVLAAHNLLRQAVREKDFDLMAALISDENDDWRQLQLELLNLDLFLDRRPIYLSLIPEVDTSPVVTLSPDLETAVVIEPFPYMVTSGESVSNIVWLEQTYTYQRQEESWLRVPLPQDNNFWGNWNSADYGDYFKLIYSDRDEWIADYMGVRFEALIGRICSDSAIDCPGNFHVEFRLERRPESLLRLNESYFNTNILAAQDIYHFSMPSPTLIGRPVDEADYDAIFQGYANWLAAVMTTRYLVSGGYYEDNPFELTLANWGLKPPPLPLAPLPVPQSITTPPIPFPEQDVLVACSQFNNVVLLRYNPRTNVWQDELDRVETSTIWQEGVRFNGSNMIALPDDSGILVSFIQLDDGYQSRLVALLDGQEQFWLESDFSMQLFPSYIQQQFDPSGHKLLIVDFQFFQAEGVESVAQVIPYAIDLKACQAGNCSLEQYPGIPYWSPDLSWALLVDSVSHSQLSLQNEMTGELFELGNGFSPYWLDEENFIYVNLLEEAGTDAESVPLVEISQANVYEPLSRTVLLDSAEIANEISGDDPTLPIRINSVVAHPDQPDWLFISAAIQLSEQSQSNFILSFQVGSRELTVLLQGRNFDLNGPLQILQDGQVLAVNTSYNTESSVTRLLSLISLIPLNPAERAINGQIETYDIAGLFQYDWSQDGRWFLGAEQSALRLIAPGQDYDQRINHNLESCYQTGWVNALTESSP